MKVWSRRFILAVTGIAAGWIIGMAVSGPAVAQAPAGGKGKAAPAQGKQAQGKVIPAGQFYSNVTASTLKNLTPDDFLGAMGVMAAALGWDCADCHPGAGTDKVDWVTDTPEKKTARKMVEMVAAINQTNFAGEQHVTCWTCHHGRDIPATTIALDNLYSNPNMERDDVIKAAPGAPSANSVFDKYIQALGGAQKVNALTSFIATGASVGYEGLGGNGEFTIYAKAPDQRTTQIHFKDHPERGDSTWTFDGRTGWVKVPRGLLGEYELQGNDAGGAKLEAQIDFPAQLRMALTNWRVGPMESIGDRDFVVVQGDGPNGLLGTFFFDSQTNLLVRSIRYTASPIGRVPIQTDYADYRDVGGIKFPFEITFLWLDGRYTAKLNDYKTNVNIDPAIFGKP